MLILKFKLYQIAPELDKRRMMFGDYNSFCLSFGKKFPSELYKCVYTGVIEEDNIQFALEKLFCKFNLDRPNDFTGRSISVRRHRNRKSKWRKNVFILRQHWICQNRFSNTRTRRK